MALNHYFNDTWASGNTNEQRLIEGLIIEAIQITGMDLYYLPRKLMKHDVLFGEDILSQFEYALPLEMYFKNITGFGGDKEFISKFGLEIRDRATFIVPRLRWEQVIQRKGIALLNRPSEGDLLYLPKTNSLFEIKYCNLENPFYQLGRLYVYELECELFVYSSEKIDTGVPDIDKIVDLDSTDITNMVMFSESGDQIILEDGDNIIFENSVLDARFYAANNEYIRQEGEDIIDWTESNPFGETKE